LGPNKHDTAVETIAGNSGVSKGTAMTLLGLSAPVVLHAIGREADERHLDAHGLSQFLAEQGRSATTGLPASASNLFGDTRGGAQRVEQRTKSSMNEARERLRATIDERQRRAEAPEPHRRRVGAWIAAALAVLAAILLIGRRNVPRPQEAADATQRAGERVGEEAGRVGQNARDAVQPGEQQPEQQGQTQQQQQQAQQPQQQAQPQPQQPAAPEQGAQPQAPAGQEAQQAQQPQGEQQAQGAQQPQGEQQAQPQEAAPGGVPGPATLSAVGGAAALGTFLQGTDPTPKRFVLEGIEFAPDSSDISQNAMLDSVAAQLNQFPNARIRIDGYTDATGTSAGNADLSDARANAVKRYLAARGVNESRMTAQGRSAEEPVASNDTAQGRSQNRRVELVVTSR
jgi:outer membrane protein OmpA-like peptidoglycan-associated protein